MLKAEHITVIADGKTIVDDASLSLLEHEWLMLLGPNGAGKSTLIAALSGTVPSTGSVTVLGRDMRAMKPAELAVRMGVMAQSTMLNASFTVEEVVTIGRYARRKSIFSPADDSLTAHVDEALRLVGLADKRKQSVLTLSGGEQQRVMLAQVICQDPAILILDEPANHLDLQHQQALFTLCDEWRRRPGKAVISVVHDLSHARLFADRVMLMDGGRVKASGTPDEVMTDELLNAVWHTDAAGWMKALAACWK